MNNELVSREALKETIDDITWYHINPHGELVEGAHGDSDALFKAEDIFNAIDNAPTVFDDKAYSDGYTQGTCDCEHAHERPQDECVEKYEKILQIVEHWNDKSSSFVSACEAFEKILDVTKGGAE